MEIVEPPSDLVLLPPLAGAETISEWADDVESDDPRLKLLMDGASAAVRRHCGWHIAPVVRDTITVTDHYGGGRLDVLVPSGRLRAVTAVRVDGRAVRDFAWDESGAIWAGTLSNGPHRIEVDVEHGYHLKEVPDLAAVVVQVSVLALASPKGAIREQAGQVAITWSQTQIGVSGGLSLLDRDLATINAYRLEAAP
ncbi:hypothetical protein [Brachybacterium sp.]|uniref:hypothetical protein n=1 Tax=Brachybacterium sp. TaxID=1891286 RepID=UPI002ED551FE